MRIRVEGSVRPAVVGLLIFALGCGDVTGPPGSVDLSESWITATPAGVGLEQAGLDAAVTAAGAIPQFRSLLVAKDGRLVLERYFGGTSSSTLFDVRSVTKSVVSLLTGIAIERGDLPGLDTPIGPYLTEDFDLDDIDRTITIRHLLSMTSGIDWDETSGPSYGQWISCQCDHVQYLFDRPHRATPGETFTYNSAAVHVLGVVLEEATGRSLPDYAAQHLFRPLGIERVAWESVGGGRVNGGSGIDLRGRDLLRLGQLVLQRGFSGSKRIVSTGWVDQSTVPAFSWHNQSPLRALTYGYLWWVVDAEPRASFAWGYGGQFVYVVPSLDLVVVATTESRGLDSGEASALGSAGLDIIDSYIVAAAIPGRWNVARE